MNFVKNMTRKKGSETPEMTAKDECIQERESWKNKFEYEQKDV